MKKIFLRRCPKKIQQISDRNSNNVFFSTKKSAFYLKKNAILCLFLKKISPSKRVVCFILNYSHLYSSETSFVFFSTKKSAFYLKKNAIFCLFLKKISPSKRVVCFISNNSHLPMVEDIAFYPLYKSKVLILPCKADDFCLFIGLPDFRLISQHTTY